MPNLPGFVAVLRLTEISLFLPRLPETLSGLRVLHLSDLHTVRYGPRERRLHQTINQGCDLLVCTGDICREWLWRNPFCPRRLRRCPVRTGLSWRGLFLRPHIDRAVAVCRTLLADFSGPMPPVFIQGNHDPDELIDRLDALGVLVLRNQARAIDLPGRGRFNLSGVGGRRRDQVDVPRALIDVDPGLFTIALCHYPELGEAFAAAGVDLVLAGHTHGGQIRLPGGRSLMTHSRTGRQYSAGMARLGDTYIYTSRGLGTSIFPLRICCPPEIVRFTLRCADTPRVVIHERNL